VRHLIHIGYAKAGTHFVQRWFASHPQIQYDQTGIAGARTAEDLVRQIAADRAGKLWRVTSSERIAAPERLETTSRSAAQRLACQGLAELFPDASILLLTRGFRSLLISGYSQSVRSGRSEDFFAFRKASRAEKAEAADMWHYDHLIGIYRAAFSGRVIILPYELLRDDPAAFVGELERRLGLDPAPMPLDRVYPALSGVELRWYPRITRALTRLPLGGSLKGRILSHYVKSVDRNAWRLLISGLQRFFPAEPVSDSLIPDEAVEFFRGRAGVLREEPLYAHYASDYLIE
jgi:hypothetical protein